MPSAANLATSVQPSLARGIPPTTFSSDAAAGSPPPGARPAAGGARARPPASDPRRGRLPQLPHAPGQPPGVSGARQTRALPPLLHPPPLGERVGPVAVGLPHKRARAVLDRHSRLHV